MHMALFLSVKEQFCFYQLFKRQYSVTMQKSEAGSLYHSMLSQLDQPSRAVLRAYYRASLAYSLVYFRWALYCGYKDCSALISVVDSNLADNDRLQRIKYILFEEPIPYFKHLFNDIQNELH